MDKTMEEDNDSKARRVYQAICPAHLAETVCAYSALWDIEQLLETEKVSSSSKGARYKTPGRKDKDRAEKVSLL